MNPGVPAKKTMDTAMVPPLFPFKHQPTGKILPSSILKVKKGQKAREVQVVQKVPEVLEVQEAQEDGSLLQINTRYVLNHFRNSGMLLLTYLIGHLQRPRRPTQPQ